MFPRPPLVAATGLLVLLAATCVSAPARAGVWIGISPETLTVAPGATFDVTVTVNRPASPFSGFQLRLAYDPDALTPVTIWPMKSQIGAVMTDACSNLFHQFRANGGIDSVDVALLCPDTWVTGPGELYHLRFRASQTQQVTALRFLPETAFADTGLWVDDVWSTGAGIGIGESPVLSADAGREPGPGLRAWPNPAHGEVMLAFAGPVRGTGELIVRDVQGREVRRLDVAEGQRAIRWDGRTNAGARAAPGTYLVLLRAGAREWRSRVTQVR